MDYNKLINKNYLSNDIINDSCKIIEETRNDTYRLININLLIRNWLLGRRIQMEELKGKERAKYGEEVIINLSNSLTNKYGSGFNKTNLYAFLSFYEEYPKIFHTPCGKFDNLLTWSHYRLLVKIESKEERDWYEKEAFNETWSVKTLERNIHTQYYYRVLKTGIKDKHKDNKELLKLEFIKNPMITEFLSLPDTRSFNESTLESNIINNLQRFMLELGKGYSFVGRQYRLKTCNHDYYIDLVFYNYILKCFVLIDLKTSKITHQDVGQMDMYIKIFDELKKNDDDNPTLGIVLCSETDEDIAKYSILNDNNQLFMSKYRLYLPSIEELKHEIESQKSIYELQNDLFK